MSGARILLVEDDEVLCDLVKRNLEAREHEVSVAEDAHAALVYLRATSFDLIILDINLPDQTGWDVLRAALTAGRIKPLIVEGQGEKLPVVVLSALRAGPGRLAEFHPLAYLPKPFPMDALLRLAAEAAQRRTAGAQHKSGESTDSQNLQLDEEELHA